MCQELCDTEMLGEVGMFYGKAGCSLLEEPENPGLKLQLHHLYPCCFHKFSDLSFLFCEMEIAVVPVFGDCCFGD